MCLRRVISKEIAAYAYGVLAKTGKGKIGVVRYFINIPPTKISVEPKKVTKTVIANERSE